MAYEILLLASLLEVNVINHVGVLQKIFYCLKSFNCMRCNLNLLFMFDLNSTICVLVQVLNFTHI